MTTETSTNTASPLNQAMRSLDSVMHGLQTLEEETRRHHQAEAGRLVAAAKLYGIRVSPDDALGQYETAITVGRGLWEMLSAQGIEAATAGETA